MRAVEGRGAAPFPCGQKPWAGTLLLQAFRFARKYAKQDVNLFYNDYDTFFPWKRDVICEQVLKPLLSEQLVKMAYRCSPI